MLKLSLTLLLCAAVCSAHKSYQGYQLLRVDVNTVSQRDFLHAAQVSGEYDVWADKLGVNMSVLLLVSPHKLEHLKAQLNSRDFSYTAVSHNVEELVLRTNPRNLSDTFDFKDYHNYDSMLTYVDKLVSANDFASVKTVGSSVEGRDIKMVTLSTGGDGSKPAIYIDGGTHAREWIAHATSMYALDSLVNNEQYKALLNDLDFYIIPVVNPDGYEYTQEDRMWRKNRAINEGSSCMGVDPNRNFDFHWGESGTSNNPCSDIYRGPSAMSEPEMQTVKAAVEPIRKQLKLFLTIHSCAQSFLSPYGYARIYPDNHEEHLAMGKAMSDAMFAVHGFRFEYGNCVDILGAAAGATDDFAKGSMEVPMVFTVELRDYEHGFILPPKEIIPQGQDFMASLEAAAKIVIEQYKN